MSNRRCTARGWLSPNGEENVRNEEERKYGERRRDESKERGKLSRLQIERARRRCIGIIIADTTGDRYRRIESPSITRNFLMY